MQWFAQAPANIALVKYMGKKDPTVNQPANSSLSYTLDDLLSFCEIESHGGGEDFWEPLVMPAGRPFTLNENAQARYLSHLAFIKRSLDFTGGFTVRSCNNFSMSAGLASSASSFAALTKAAANAICELQKRDALSDHDLAQLSQHGSGSSCRSFFPGWVLWDENGVKPLSLPYTNLIHHVVIVDHQQKQVSSSSAHQRVTSSTNFEGRPERAESRLQELLSAFSQQNWSKAYSLVRDEFRDMHQLFETANPPFSYQTEASKQVLHDVERLWSKQQDGPLITMDAGPNVHLLFRSDQRELANSLKEKFLNDFDVI